MVPSKSRKSESRRSSILKPRRPRQPLQNVNLDSSSNENSPTASKVKRRVSFAETKHVKEFCHSTEQGTVWDNTYEEHDSSLKGSFTHEQNIEAESKENASVCTSKNTTVRQEEDNVNSIDLVNSVGISEGSQLEYTLPNATSHIFKDTLSNILYSNTDEKYIILGKESQQIVMPDAVSYTSENARSSNIIYRDSDEEDCASGIWNKCYTESRSNNDNLQLNDLSMELTTPILGLSSHFHVQTYNATSHSSNIDTNYASDCNNVSMEMTRAIPIPIKTISSDCENTKWDVIDNTHGNTILPINLQRNIISEQTRDINNANDSMVLTTVIQPLTADVHCTNNSTNTISNTSMEMTAVMPSKIYGRNILHTRNKNIIKESDMRKDQTDKTELFNVPMEFTEPVNVELPSNEFYDKENVRINEPMPIDNRDILFHNTSMEMTEALSIRSGRQIGDSCKLLSEENSSRGKSANVSIFSDEKSCKSMEFTEVVPISSYHENTINIERVEQSKRKSTHDDNKGEKTKIFNDTSMKMVRPISIISSLNICDKENLKMEESVSRDNRTVFFHDVSVEMAKAVASKDQEEIIHPIISVSKVNAHEEKDKSNSACFERIKLLCKSMEFIDAVPIPLYHERTFNTAHTAQSTSFSQVMSKAQLPVKNTAGSALKTVAVSETIQDVSMEITTAIPSIAHRMQDVAPNETGHLNVSKINASQNLMTNNVTQSVEVSYSTAPITHLSAENSTGSVLRTDVAASETIQDVSMEITTAIPSITHRMQDVAPNETGHLNVSKINASQNLMTNNVTQSVEVSHPTAPITHLSAENSTGSVFRTDVAASETIQDVSMEITTAIPSIMHRMQDVAPNETGHLNVSKINASQNLMTNNVTQSVEVLHPTAPITHLSAENSAGSALRTDVAASETIQDVSMEITTAISSITHHMQNVAPNETGHLNVSKINASQNLMTNNVTQPVEISHLTAPITHLSAENSAGSALLRTDMAASETIQDVSMEITIAVPSTLHLTKDMKTVNKAESLTISKDNLTESESITKDFTISREITETANMHNKLSNICYSSSPPHNLSYSCITLENREYLKKRRSNENERSNVKRSRSSFVRYQFSQENYVHLSPRTNNGSDAERNECFVKDTVDHISACGANLKDSLNEISGCNFLRKSLPYMENSLELQSIKPPSFICFDSEEENSFHNVLSKDEFQTSMITGDVPVDNSSNRLTMDNAAESKCQEQSRVAKDYENVSREKDINIEKNQAEACQRSNIANKNEDNQETIDCEVTAKTNINGNRINEPDRHMDVENLNEERVLSEISAEHEEIIANPSTNNHCTSTIVNEVEIIDEDQMDEAEYSRKRINSDAKLRNIIEEKQYLDVKKRLETEECINHERTEAIIEDQVEEYCKENSDNEAKIQSMRQNENECVNKSFTEKQHISAIKDESLVKQDPFSLLSEKLKIYAEREDCIWNVYYKNIDRKMIVFGFMSNSLLIATFLSHDLNDSGANLIKEIKIISRVSDDAGIPIRIVHRLIREKVNAEILTQLYKTHEELLPMLNFISQDVKLAMDFMFDLKRLDDLNLMEIFYDEISFISRSQRMDVILKIAIKVKRFDKLTSDDIKVNSLLGTIKETDVKNLIKNVKRDHKFLRRYMNDVRDYIDIMEETCR